MEYKETEYKHPHFSFLESKLSGKIKDFSTFLSVGACVQTVMLGGGGGGGGGEGGTFGQI